LEQLPGFDGKNGFLTGFSKSLFYRTGGSHRARAAHSQLVLEQASFIFDFFWRFV
jgi:hypothetical protein